MSPFAKVIGCPYASGTSLPPSVTVTVSSLIGSNCTVTEAGTVAVTNTCQGKTAYSAPGVGKANEIAIGEGEGEGVGGGVGVNVGVSGVGVGVKVGIGVVGEGMGVGDGVHIGAGVSVGVGVGLNQKAIRCGVSG
jgi:hypothetical protein